MLMKESLEAISYTVKNDPLDLIENIDPSDFYEEK